MTSFAEVIRNKNSKKYISVLFSSFYLFVFFAAANFHNHNGGYFYKDFKFKGSTANFSQQTAVNNGDDCLSCHFASAPLLLPTTTQFIAIKLDSSSAKSVFMGEQNTISARFSFYLRGPPNFI